MEQVVQLTAAALTTVLASYRSNSVESAQIAGMVIGAGAVAGCGIVYGALNWAFGRSAEGVTVTNVININSNNVCQGKATVVEAVQAPVSQEEVKVNGDAADVEGSSRGSINK